MKTKRGLSNIVATVLIILLALAAVAIVWSFIRPTLEDAGTTIDLSSRCLDSDAEAITCTYDLTDPAVAVATVKVEHKRGDSTDTLIAVLQFNDDSAETSRVITPAVLSTADLTFEFDSRFGGLLPLEATAGIEVTDGVETQICNPSSIRVTCTEVTP